jgi:uncharacterized protein (TIGR03663 family)
LANPPPKIRWAIFFAVALLALAVRLPQLGERPMHSDEAVNAYITGELLAGQSFHYDPHDRHGPALFAVAEPVVRLLGAKNFSELTESQVRLTPVIAGSATVLLFGAGVECFGFITCLVAALLFAFAPLPLYYNRYFIHETLFVAATLGLMLSARRVYKTNAVPPAALAGFCAALMLAFKETAVIHFFALGVAAACAWFLESREKFPPPKIFAIAGVAFIATAILLFSWFGQNWTAMADLFRAVPNFIARAGGEGHEKPFWYYAVLLAGGWSGAVILCLAAMGMVRAFRPPRHIFLAGYALLIVVIYSAIPYKTPWLALNLWLPLAIFAGLAIEWIWFAAPKFSVRAAVSICILTLGFLIAHDTRQRVFKFPADENNPYAYAQTGGDLARLPARLEKLAAENKISNPRIAVVAADAWPLPWYLRKFSQVGYWQPGQETGDADFFITTTDLSDKLAERLKNFHREFFGSRPNVLLILWSPPNDITSHE